MVSAYALGYALFTLVAGPLSDGRDRRGVLLAGLSEFIVTTVLRGFAQGLWTMILYRFLAGVSAAFVSPQIWASIPVLVRPEQIVRTMGFATAGLSIAQCAGMSPARGAHRTTVRCPGDGGGPAAGHPHHVLTL
ncbi:hypothetical protein GCM10010512_38450 [Streptomyces thermoviolaceus subsp. thermoviolaceus]|nr:hypothetical protein GCM10010499_35500 [Streptomyces thermoviolaceus subsp. apingens]GHB03342.1 hypothetical protein GCM10010512_38450 [Streptomyces thermoviolaceus subsp. thermoviolaceus]